MEPPAVSPILSLPRVTIQLPIFNEQFVVERLGLDLPHRYPREKLDIQFLDDSTDETVEVARRPSLERYAAMGHPSPISHRTIAKASRLERSEPALKNVQGEFIAILSADFVPPEEFLMKVVHHFTDPKSAWCRRDGHTLTATTRS